MSEDITVTYQGERIDIEVFFDFYAGSDQMIHRVPELSQCGENPDYDIQQVLVDGVDDIEVTPELEKEIIGKLEEIRGRQE